MTTMTTDHSPFPSDETLAAFVDGTLDEETRKSVMEHMAGCAQCVDIVLDSTEVKAAETAPAESGDEQAKVVPIRHWQRNVVIALATAAAVVIVVLTAWPRRDPIREIADAAAGDRFGEGRLTGFRYQPYSPKRGASEGEDTSNLENSTLFQAADRVLDKAEKHPNARNLHAKGVVLLVLPEHRPEELDKQRRAALQALLAALQTETGKKDPQLLSDLAAAYLVMGKYPEALQAAQRAWNLAKTPEIAWNRAYAAERSGRRDLAITSWHDYLKLDSSSQWADEANKQLQLLEYPDAPLP